MSQLSHAQFPLRRHPNLLVDHRRSRSAAVAEPRGANGEAVTGSGGRLHFGMVAGIKSERWPTSNRNPRPDCLGIRTQWLNFRVFQHRVMGGSSSTEADRIGQDLEEETMTWTILLASISRWTRPMFAFSTAKAWSFARARRRRRLKRSPANWRKRRVAVASYSRPDAWRQSCSTG